jgi:hypothetical protein
MRRHLLLAAASRPVVGMGTGPAESERVRSRQAPLPFGSGAHFGCGVRYLPEWLSIPYCRCRFAANSSTANLTAYARKRCAMERHISLTVQSGLDSRKRYSKRDCGNSLATRLHTDKLENFDGAERPRTAVLKACDFLPQYGCGTGQPPGARTETRPERDAGAGISSRLD